MYIYDMSLSKISSGYLVEIPEFETSFDFKGGRREAIVAAAEYLRACIQERVIDGEDVPDSRDIIAPRRGAEVVTLALEVEPPLDEFISISQAMQILGVSQSRISHMIRDNRLEAIKYGRRKLITKNSLEAYLETPRRPGRPKKGYTYEYVNLEQEAEASSDSE